MLNGFGWPHLLIIAVLIILLFGAKRLPDAARGIGKSMRIFKAETRGMQDEDANNQGAQSQQQNPQQYQQPAPQNGAFAAPQQLTPPQPATTPAEQHQPTGEQQR